MFFNLRREPQPSFFSVATEREKFWYGIFMWFLLFFGYMIFCTNWIIMGKLEGGWKNLITDSTIKKDSQVLIEAVNYSVPFARGLATIPVAYIMTKLSHKYAVIIALALNTAAFPLIYSTSFAPFVFGRMIMACGGTMLIIYVQPILAKFFNLKQKGVLTMLTSFAYVLGALIANFIFVYKGENGSVANLLNARWKQIAGICGLFSYFPLIFYIAYAKNFRAEETQQEEIDLAEKPENTYMGIIKERSLWFWVFWYSFLLVASVMVSNFAPKLIKSINKDLVEKTFTNWDWSSLYTICFYFGCLFGFSLGLWNKTQFRRKPFVVLCCFVGIFFWVGIVLTAKFLSSNSHAATALIFLFAFLFAFFSMGIQTVILYIPHEYPINRNAKRITIFYSYLWGLGYIIFALYYLSTAIVFDIGVPSSTAATVTSTHIGAYISTLMVTIFVLMFGVFALLIKEPRPDWPMHPWDKGKNNYSMLAR